MNVTNPDVTETSIAAPSQENGSDHGPDGKFIPGNQAAVKTGIYRREQPLDLRMSAQELTAGIVADLGGAENLTTLERAYISHLGDLSITLRLAVADLATHGLLTPGGRPRHAYAAFLAGVDRFDRLGSRIGLKRRDPKNITDLARQLAGMDR